ncbi:peroxin, partial [Podochytrium sp. JEL0797]
MVASKRSLVGRLLVGTTALVATGYVAYRYAIYALEESEKERARDRAAKQNLTLRFQQNLRDCRSTVLKLVPVICSQLYPQCDVEAITESLQSLRKTDLSPDEIRKRKACLWEDLKIASFTRTVSALYLINLLHCFTHIQLNIIGRFTYLATASPSAEDLSYETERKFLMFSWYLLHTGLFECTARVKQAVESSLAG